MARNWNKIWRYLHLSLGLLLVVYHARIAYYHQGMFGVTTLWPAEVDEFVSIYLIFFVMWTGLAKWPIYPWYKKRQNRKKREAKEAAATGWSLKLQSRLHSLDIGPFRRILLELGVIVCSWSNWVSSFLNPSRTWMYCRSFAEYLLAIHPWVLMEQPRAVEL